MKNMTWLAVTVAAALFMGCGDDPDNGMAAATIAPTMGNTVTGTATFTKTDGSVSLTVTVASATPGVHGVHIHHVPMCGTDGAAAGGHWDGTAAAGEATTHGLPGATPSHLGEVGNVTVAAAGTGTITYANSGWKLGDGSLTDVVNHSVIFHAAMDDGTMPSAGARQGCGIITEM